jgi:hypothetical protein
MSGMRRRPSSNRLATLALLILATPLAARQGAPAPAAPEVSASREAVLAHLERTRGLFLDSIAGLTPEQWAWKPAPDRWSVAECAEHITRTEAFLRDLTSGVVREPGTAEELAASHGQSATILAMVTDRSQRFQAPEPLNPARQGEMRSREQIVRDFNFERGRSYELAAAHDDLEAYAKTHPALEKPLDLAGWIYFLSAHVERHTKQIEEVKATAGFPRG